MITCHTTPIGSSPFVEGGSRDASTREKRNWQARLLILGPSVFSARAASGSIVRLSDAPLALSIHGGWAPMFLGTRG